MTQTTNHRIEQYPGYPIERLALEVAHYESLQNIELPNGPWNLNTKPLPTFDESLSFITEGYETDSLGRPLHPWAKSLLSAEAGGAVLGKGAYWHWGPNATADPIVITKEVRPRILLVTRKDTGELAFPGGFVDKNEDPYDAAVRELEEETEFVTDIQGELVYRGPIADPRATLHAWPETTAYLFVVDKPLAVKESEESIKVAWPFIDELPENIFGSHSELIQKALEMYEGRTRTIRDILAIPETDRKTILVDAGHMAYRHYTTEHQDTALFVKEHDASQFSDPKREAHSRAYLEKEYAQYKHLAMQGFKAIPERVELVDDSLLAMDHFSAENGWKWRAPCETLTPYTEDILTALDSLQYTQPIDAPDYHEAISPTYETLWREGWDTIDDDNAEKIIEKIDIFAAQWESTQQAAALQLKDAFEALRAQAATLTRTPELFPAHNDARQSNIAWHPEYGVKIVDWSWADPAPFNADVTMFLIDLAKSGHDIKKYREKINKDHALVLLGFWLAHSIWETRDGSTTVREHQVASASSTYQLL